MSELGNKLKLLRGDASMEEVAARAGVNLRTYWRAEHGVPVKIETLDRISRALPATSEQWVALLMAWIRDQIGESNWDLLQVNPRAAGPRMADENTSKKIARRLIKLPLEDQAAVMKAVDRPELLQVIRAYNALSDEIRANPRKNPKMYPTKASAPFVLNEKPRDR